MQLGDHRRTPQEIELDKEFASLQWKRGFSFRQIANQLTEEHERIGNPYKVSYGIVARDIKETIAEAKKLREESGISDIEDLIDKAEYLYNESVEGNMLHPHPAWLANADRSLTQLAKLKGLAPDKVEVSIKYDIEI